MIHYFDIDIATKYGVNEAILLQNIHYWCEHNSANKTNFYDDHYWTYNSNAGWQKLFPYLSKNTIIRTIENLKKEGLIITGCYNEVKFDRKLWYAVTAKGLAVFLHLPKTQNAITQNEYIDNQQMGESELPKMGDSDLPKTGTPIADNKQDNKQDNKKEKTICLSEFTEQEQISISHFIDHRKEIKKPLTTRALELALTKLLNFKSQGKNISLIIDQSILKGWQDLFDIKTSFNQPDPYEPTPCQENYWGGYISEDGIVYDSDGEIRGGTNIDEFLKIYPKTKDLRKVVA